MICPFLVFFAWSLQILEHIQSVISTSNVDLNNIIFEDTYYTVHSLIKNNSNEFIIIFIYKWNGKRVFRYELLDNGDLSNIYPTIKHQKAIYGQNRLIFISLLKNNLLETMILLSICGLSHLQQFCLGPHYLCHLILSYPVNIFVWASSIYFIVIYLQFIQFQTFHFLTFMKLNIIINHKKSSKLSNEKLTQL